MFFFPRSHNAPCLNGGREKKKEERMSQGRGGGKEARGRQVSRPHESQLEEAGGGGGARRYVARVDLRGRKIASKLNWELSTQEQ